MNLVERLARPEILALEPYAHASWDPSLERLNANENPWRFPGDESIAGLNRYPEPAPHAVEARLAELYGVAPANLIAGRGSDEAIDLLARAFLVPGRDAIVTCPPTFGMYALSARVQGARVIEVPLVRAAGYALDEPAVLAALARQPKLVFLCSPGNPSGRCLDGEAIRRIATAAADRALIVVDEAYAEFSPEPSFIGCFGTLPNVVVLRTLSKAYALAGARCGAAIAGSAVIDLMRRVLPPYSMPTPTVEAVLAALAPEPLTRARSRIELLVRERERLAAALATVPLVRQVYPSDANFVLVECRDAAALVARGRQAGFLLRDFSHGPHTPGSVRISVGTPEQNDRLLAELARP